LIYDTIIVGAGGAALTSALRLKQNNKNLKILVVTKQNPTASQTCMAQGGINAPIDDNEIKIHIEDTIKSAQGLANEDSINIFCNNSKNSIEWLKSIGVPFDNNEKGEIKKRKLGGVQIPQAVHCADYTGLKIIHTLFENCVKNNIEIIYNKFLLNLIIEDKIIKGITALDIENSETIEILAKSVIIASGGYSAIYKDFTTNSSSTSGDGIASTLRSGGKISNMEFVQFHPTALKNSSILISESARAEGGYLINDKNERFVNELDTRDKVAQEIYKQIENGNQVFLDIRHLGEDKIKNLLPQERKLCINHENIDPINELIPIKPVAHYSMGGIKTNIDCSTNINGLFSCGEASCVGVHGANRLGGNSLLELVVFGNICANSVDKYLNENNISIEENHKIFLHDKEYISQIFSRSNEINFYKRKEELGKLFYKNCGILRNNQNLNDLLKIVKQYKEEYKLMGINDKTKNYNTNLVEFLEFGNMLEIAEVIVTCAILREESRGSHFREDFISNSTKFQKNSISWTQDKILYNEFK
jgi:succinate dehydrogenase/fumarate reductase flavoprotein subunit